MDRKLKLAAASLVALTATACAPNPYWPGNTAAGAYNGNRSATVAPAANAVTHTHCGRTHTHVLPPEGLAHHHGDGCMAGTGGAVTTTPQNYTYTQPPAYTAPPAYTPPPAAYTPPPASTGTSGTYGYTDPGNTTYYNYGGTTAGTTGNNTGSYYEYSAPKPATGTSGSTYSSPTTGSSTGSSYSSGSSAATSSGDSYVVQKGDTVFQVMRNTGVYWKDIIRLNNLQAPNYSISAGQRLKLK